VPAETGMPLVVEFKGLHHFDSFAHFVKVEAKCDLLVLLIPYLLQLYRELSSLILRHVLDKCVCSSEMFLKVYIEAGQL
jgi:hypothetical protein